MDTWLRVIIQLIVTFLLTYLWGKFGQLIIKRINPRIVKGARRTIVGGYIVLIALCVLSLVRLMIKSEVIVAEPDSYYCDTKACFFSYKGHKLSPRKLYLYNTSPDTLLYYPVTYKDGIRPIVVDVPERDVIVIPEYALREIPEQPYGYFEIPDTYGTPGQGKQPDEQKWVVRQKHGWVDKDPDEIKKSIEILTKFYSNQQKQY